MSLQISIKKIISATLRGIENSQKQYSEWSGGYWLWEAPEYLITINVARSIARINGSKYLTLENSTREAMKDAGAVTKGRLPRDIRSKGKIDILLWWGNDNPRAVIEIKNQIYSKSQYMKDIKRIKQFLIRNFTSSTLQFGLFGFYDSAKAENNKSANDKIKFKINSLLKESKNILGDGFKVELFKSALHSEDESAWIAACILVQPV